MVKYLKIPTNRIGILLKDDARVSKRIEEATKTKINIDSELNEVSISKTSESNPLQLWKAKDTVKAIGRGFKPEVAFRLLEKNTTLIVINLKEYLGKSKKARVRIKGRIIGKDGKSKRKIQNLTNTNLVVHGNTVSIIGSPTGAEIAAKGVEMLINGSMHGAVFKSIEKEAKKKAKKL